MVHKMDAPRPAPKKCRHLFEFLSYSGRGVGGRKVTLPGGAVIKTAPLTLGFICKHCGENVERKATAGERKFHAKRVSLDMKTGIHKVWHEFNRRFRDKDDPDYRWIGFELMERVETWAKRYPRDVRIIGVDDSHHASSILVLIEHQTERTYMGTTVVYIPQCTGDGPTEFFLYPGHARGLVGALKDITQKSKRVISLENKDRVKDTRSVRRNLRHPPVI